MFATAEEVNVPTAEAELNPTRALSAARTPTRAPDVKFNVAESLPLNCLFAALTPVIVKLIVDNATGVGAEETGS